tara:strand:- start:2001 stop:3698 length:1698 start_codon:yes stop_codon:yes gene_type:complete
MRYFLYSFFILFLISCSDIVEEDEIFLSPDDLIEHSKEFKKEIISIENTIHVAIGYSLANSIMVEGESGRIIIDTTGTIETGREVRSAFDRINPFPIKAVIYTHNHGDHVFGAKAFVDDENTIVLAHEDTHEYINRILGILRPIISKRSSRMFGTIPEEQIENNGIGPFLEIGKKNRSTSLVYPNRTFKDFLKLEISGIEVHLYHAPGETNDQLFVWLPKYKALFPGDNFYKAFPNLYTIRGTPYRDLSGWVKSIDLMRYLKPEYLIPSHSRPLEGQELIFTHLTDYRDAIQFVHDQTIRLMNKGFEPDKITEFITLPEHLVDSPYLKEFYGTPAWSAKNVFSGYLGWFDGNPTSLNPLSKELESQKIIKMSGGFDKVLKSVNEAIEEEDYQWALNLTDYLLTSDPENQTVINLRIKALNQLGKKSSNPNSRYYYLSSASELSSNYKPFELLSPSEEIIEAMPVEVVFDILKVNLIPKKSLDKELTLSLFFSDTSKSFTLILRKGVLEVQPFEVKGAKVKIYTEEKIWKEIVAGTRSLPVSMATGMISVEGDKVSLISFFNSFRE